VIRHQLLDGFQDIQGFSDVRSRSGLRREDVSDNSFLVNYKADATGQQTECLLDAVGLPHRTIRIAQQYERQMMLLSEIAMRVLTVGAYSNNLCAEILERFVGVSECARFRCTASGEVFGIEVNDHVLLSNKISESNVTAIAGRQSEAGCGVTDSEQIPYFPRVSCESDEDEAFVEKLALERAKHTSQ
jgi:hypothetical protein